MRRGCFGSCQPPNFRVEGNSLETCLVEHQSPDAVINSEEISRLLRLFARIFLTNQSFCLGILLPLFAPEEEKRVGYFSPEFNGHACESQADGELNYLRSPAHSSAYSDSPSTSKENLSKPAGEVASHYNGTTWTEENSDGDLNQIKPFAGKEKDQFIVKHASSSLVMRCLDVKLVNVFSQGVFQKFA
ncbi:hypothetical protein CRYUN_Cryun20dG0094900 [Craigia yunnanensis]